MRLATFNIENLGGRRAGEARLEERAKVLRPQLERLRADVLCLQEVNTTKAAGVRRPKDLERLLTGTPYENYQLVLSSGRAGGPYDIHNLAILSRLPVVSQDCLHHRLVQPPVFRSTLTGSEPAGEPVMWDRPIQYAVLELAGGRHLHVFNVHLRAPLASYIPGQKADGFSWKTTSGWAEGFFLSGIKRVGQALEVRLAVDLVFRDNTEALIAVCGDFNAEDRETPLRLVCAGEDDTGSGHLAPFVLTPVARSLPTDRRFTAVHHGRQEMPDHILATRHLFAGLVEVEIHNEMLEDELVAYGRIDRPPESTHAPIVAAFDIG